MTSTVNVLEEISRVAPAGVRFWDVAAGRIADGLIVSVYPDGVPELRRPGVAGKSGIYSFRALPTMGDVEMGRGDDAYWLANEGRTAFTLEVSDPAGQLLPWQWKVRLPHRGLLTLTDSPAALQLAPDATWVPMLSAPARSFDRAMGVVRAQLLDATTFSPAKEMTAAAWALLEVRAGGAGPVYGLADARGTVAVPIPYPAPPATGVGSPIAGDRIPLSLQTWPLKVRVFYGRLPASRFPDLLQVLRQPAALAWQDQALTTALVADPLRFGRETVLRTRNGATPRAELLITV